MGWVGRVGAAGRFGVEAKAGIVEFLHAGAGGVVTHDRVLAQEMEEGAPVFLAGSMFSAIGERSEDFDLLFRGGCEERGAVKAAGVGVDPIQAVTERELKSGIGGRHDVDELGGAGGSGSGQDDLRQAIEQAEFGGGEEARGVGGGADLGGALRRLKGESTNVETRGRQRRRLRW